MRAIRILPILLAGLAAGACSGSDPGTSSSGRELAMPVPFPMDATVIVADDDDDGGGGPGDAGPVADASAWIDAGDLDAWADAGFDDDGGLDDGDGGFDDDGGPDGWPDDDAGPDAWPDGGLAIDDGGDVSDPDGGIIDDFCQPCTWDDPNCPYDVFVTEFKPLGVDPGFTYQYHLGSQPSLLEYRLVGYNGSQPLLIPYFISGDAASYTASHELEKWNGFDKWNDPFRVNDGDTDGYPGYDSYEPYFEDESPPPGCGYDRYTAYAAKNQTDEYPPSEAPYDCNCRGVAEATARQIAQTWPGESVVVAVTYNGNGPGTGFAMPPSGTKGVETKSEKRLGSKGGIIKVSEVKNDAAKKALDVAEANEKRAVENAAKRHDMPSAATRFDRDVIGGAGPEASLAAVRILKKEGESPRMVARDGGYMEENPLYQTTQQKIPTKQLVPTVPALDIHDFKEAAEANRPVYGYHVALWAHTLRQHVSETRGEFSLKWASSSGKAYIEYTVLDKDGANPKVVQDQSKNGRLLLFLGAGKQRSAPAENYKQDHVPVKNNLDHFKVLDRAGVEVDLTTTELAKVELERRNIPVADGVLPLPETPHPLGDPAYSLQGRYKNKSILLLGDGNAAVQTMEKLKATGVDVGTVHWSYGTLETVKKAGVEVATGKAFLLELATDPAKAGAWGRAYTERLVNEGNELKVEVTFASGHTGKYDVVLHATGQSPELPVQQIPKEIMQGLRLAVNPDGRVVGLITANGKVGLGGIGVETMMGQLRGLASAATPDTTRLPFQDAARTLKMCDAFDKAMKTAREADVKDLKDNYGFAQTPAQEHITPGNLFTWSKNTADFADGNYTPKEAP